MKKYLLLLLSLILFIPGFVKAEEIDLSLYNSGKFEDVLVQEGVPFGFSNYNGDDAKVTIYLFRGQGCSHCYELLTFFSNELVPKYGNDVKIVSYEVWYDASNAKLMNKVASFLGDYTDGVPYFIIGDQSFSGFIDSMSSDIYAAVDEQLGKKKPYDVFKEMNKKSREINNFGVVICTGILLIIASAVVIIVVKNDNKKTRDMLKEVLDTLNK